MYHGRMEFHEIAYRLLQCLQSLLGTASRIVARILQTLQCTFKANSRQIVSQLNFIDLSNS